jgi:adenosylmethionine-8-amino-7-oxononanoate aminotransferase
MLNDSLLPYSGAELSGALAGSPHVKEVRGVGLLCGIQVKVHDLWDAEITHAGTKLRWVRGSLTRPPIHHLNTPSRVAL